jgi:hypothetical protein
MPQSGIKIARESVPLDDSDYDIQESIWYKCLHSDPVTWNVNKARSSTANRYL